MSRENTKNNRRKKGEKGKMPKDLVVLFDFLIFGERVVGARFPFFIIDVVFRSALISPLTPRAEIWHGTLHKYVHGLCKVSALCVP